MKLTIFRAAAVLSAALALAAGVALATRGDSVQPAPTATGAVNACIGADGAVRVVSAASACRSGEHGLVWGAQGDPGPPGPAGARGPSGARGAPGKAGDVGPPGPPGVIGESGPSGPAGARGATGARGAAGAAGAVGAAGTRGPTGATGAPGVAGPQGATGAAGAAGPAGATGATGPKGTSGATGPAGPAGPAGTPGTPGQGITSFDDLGGLPCTTPLGGGSVQITYDALDHATLTCVVPHAAVAIVRVNEVETGTTTAAADEFVELVNAGGAAADISGWKLVYRSASGTADTTLVAIPAGTSLAAGGFYLFGGNAYAGARTADQSFSTGLAAAGGGVAIRDANGAVVDSVGWGTAANAYVEGNVAPAPPTTASPGSSIVRRPDGHDTDDNSADFTVAAIATPRAPN